MTSFYYDNLITGQLAVIRLQDRRGERKRAMARMIEVEAWREESWITRENQRIKTDNWTRRRRLSEDEAGCGCQSSLQNLIPNTSLPADLSRSYHQRNHMLFCDANQNLQAHFSLSQYNVQVCVITTGKDIHHRVGG